MIPLDTTLSTETYAAYGPSAREGSSGIYPSSTMWAFAPGPRAAGQVRGVVNQKRITAALRGAGFKNRGPPTALVNAATSVQTDGVYDMTTRHIEAGVGQNLRCWLVGERGGRL